MSDLSTPEEIRAEACERLARARYERCAPAQSCRQPWGELDYRERADRISTEESNVDALGDLLPTAVEGRYIGRGLLRRTRYVTDWREPEETE